MAVNEQSKWQQASKNRNWSRDGKASYITGCTGKRMGQHCQIRNLKRLLSFRNRDNAEKVNTVGVNDNFGWPNRRMWIRVLFLIVEYCG